MVRAVAAKTDSVSLFAPLPLLARAGNASTVFVVPLGYGGTQGGVKLNEHSVAAGTEKTKLEPGREVVCRSYLESAIDVNHEARCRLFFAPW